MTRASKETQALKEAGYEDFIRYCDTWKGNRKRRITMDLYREKDIEKAKAILESLGFKQSKKKPYRFTKWEMQDDKENA